MRQGRKPAGFAAISFLPPPGGGGTAWGSASLVSCCAGGWVATGMAVGSCGKRGKRVREHREQGELVRWGSGERTPFPLFPQAVPRGVGGGGKRGKRARLPLKRGTASPNGKGRRAPFPPFPPQASGCLLMEEGTPRGAGCQRGVRRRTSGWGSRGRRRCGCAPSRTAPGTAGPRCCGSAGRASSLPPSASGCRR